MKVFCDDKLVNDSNLNKVLEPGFLFGWGAFETFLINQRKPVFLDRHLNRLKTGLDFLDIEYPKLDFIKTINELLEANELFNAYARITVFKKRKNSGVIIYAAQFTYYQPEVYRKGVSLVFYPHKRYSKDPFLKLKSISYGHNRLAWNFAQKQDKDEAVFLSEDGFIQEGSRSNIFFLKDGQLCTPAVSCGLLEGVTRNAVIDVCDRIGVKVNQGVFSRNDLLQSQEIFITSSLMGVMPVFFLENQKLDTDKYMLVPRINEEYLKILE